MHERAFETQKKALYTRFSQSIPLLPSLNGYGQLEGTLSEGTKGQEGYVPQSVTVDTAAESFVRDGLSKVMKITNICDNEHLSDCGLPDKIIPIDGSSALNISNIDSLAKFNSLFSGKITSYDGSSNIMRTYEQLDTKAAAFETVNGESILVYYNPNCEPDIKTKDYYFTQANMCANFIYDLNGKKGPNTVGKDIGAISAIYSTDPIVIMPDPYPSNTSQNITFEEAFNECKNIDTNLKVPNIDTMTSLIYNKSLFKVQTGIHYITSSAFSSTQAWRVSSTSGLRIPSSKISTWYTNVRCVK